MFKVFLIDDAVTMGKHWRALKEFFAAFAYFIKRLDRDGLDLYFSVSRKSRKGEKDTTPLIELVKEHAPTNVPSNLAMRLEELLGDYKRKLTSWSQVKGLQIYILTDGVWYTDSDAEELIRSFIRFLDAKSWPQNTIGIQFIRFGDNEGGIARLEKLDKLGKTEKGVTR